MPNLERVFGQKSAKCQCVYQRWKRSFAVGEFKLVGLSEGGLLVQARGNGWGHLIFKDLVKFGQRSVIVNFDALLPRAERPVDSAHCRSQPDMGCFTHSEALRELVRKGSGAAMVQVAALDSHREPERLTATDEQRSLRHSESLLACSPYFLSSLRT
jgi:hypothetical protein